MKVNANPPPQLNGTQTSPGESTDSTLAKLSQFNGIQEYNIQAISDDIPKTNDYLVII